MYLWGELHLQLSRQVELFEQCVFTNVRRDHALNLFYLSSTTKTAMKCQCPRTQSHTPARMQYVLVAFEGAVQDRSHRHQRCSTHTSSLALPIRSSRSTYMSAYSLFATTTACEVRCQWGPASQALGCCSLGCHTDQSHQQPYPITASNVSTSTPYRLQTAAVFHLTYNLDPVGMSLTAASASGYTLPWFHRRDTSCFEFPQIRAQT